MAGSHRLNRYICQSGIPRSGRLPERRPVTVTAIPETARPDTLFVTEANLQRVLSEVWPMAYDHPEGV